jgi:hypothetical protein
MVRSALSHERGEGRRAHVAVVSAYVWAFFLLRRDA